MLRPGSAAGNAAPEAVTTLRGVVHAVIFAEVQSDDAGTVIFAMRTGDGRRHKVIAEDADVGAVQPGVRLRVVGVAERHPQHGPQVRGRVEFDTSAMDLRGLRAFLAERLPGVGDALAGRLVDAYGFEVVAVLRDTDRAAEDGILRADVAAAARDYLGRHAGDMVEVTAELFQILCQTGARNWRRHIRRLLRRYRSRAAALLREDPIGVCLDGAVSFRASDWLHRNAGGDPADPDRHLAALVEELRDGRDNLSATWHVGAGLPREFANARGEAEPLDLPAAVARGVGRRLLRRDDVRGSAVYALEPRARDEERLAAALADARRGVPCWPALVGLDVTPHQLDALRDATAGAVGLLVGPPGVGKSHAAAEVVRAAVNQGVPVRVAAPTGKAAQRQRELLSRHSELRSVETSTIHRLLGAMPADDGDRGSLVFAKGKGDPLPVGLFVIDEASMIDCGLAARLFEAVPAGSAVLLLGDLDQLPSVGHGLVLADLAGAGLPTGRLDQPMRHGDGLLRKVIAAARDNSAMPDLPRRPSRDHDFALVDGDDLAALARVLDWLEGEGLRPDEVQVVAPTNRTCAAVNAALQARWNPSADPEDTPGRPRAGDRVVNRENRFLASALAVPGEAGGKVFVANGEQGLLASVGDDRAAVVALASGDAVATHVPHKGLSPLDRHGERSGLPDRFNEWSLGYSLTCHRAQGSEWPAVVVLLEDAPPVDRAWVYTALSRGRRHVVALGKEAVLTKALGRRNAAGRVTLLRRRVRGDEA